MVLVAFPSEVNADEGGDGIHRSNVHSARVRGAVLKVCWNERKACPVKPGSFKGPLQIDRG
jgi:hypothetical protein